MAKSYPPELKAQVITEWMAGVSEASLAQAYKVPKTTISGWVKGRARPPAVPKNKEQEEAYDLDKKAWGLVDGSFAALSRIHRVTEDDAWLKRQNAADLAIFAGVISDKLIRLLGAVQRPRQGSESDAGSNIEGEAIAR